jgi:Na+-transporting methylmalonyl-CoA/oxaloacetate decarboxylase gamma subunit
MKPPVLSFAKTAIKQQFSPLAFVFIFLCVVLLFFFFAAQSASKNLSEQKAHEEVQAKNTQQALQALQSQDQYKINQTQKAEIDHIHKSYQEASHTYEKLQDL